jgi:hypothetical protein
VFTPDGYQSIRFVVALLAVWGKQGKLPRSLGFVHPEDAAEPDDLPAEETAHFVMGEKLAAGAIQAEAIIDPSGMRILVPARYWSSGSAYVTMKDGWLDLSVLGLDNDLHIARVIIEIDAVTAALGVRQVPPQEDVPPANLLPVDAWMLEYATQFIEKHSRPPARDNEAVVDATAARFGQNAARAAYAKLPAHLKVPNRKPRKPKPK